MIVPGPLSIYSKSTDIRRLYILFPSVLTKPLTLILLNQSKLLTVNMNIGSKAIFSLLMRCVASP